jgi:hypothetical protein
MKKLYYKLVKLIGYTILFDHTLGSDFNYKIKYSHISLYKYIGMYDPKYGGMKLRRVSTIKIR